MQALTSPVPKVPEHPQIHQLRPITVLSQTYRLWAKVICKQLLQHFSHHLPAELTGLLVGRGPLDSAMRQQHWIEVQRYRQADATGICLDLIKCFNTIHRPRVKALFLHLGLPEQVVQQWFMSLQDLQRIWTCQGWCSPATSTANGLPEGDSWSVVGMVLLDLLWLSSFRQHSPDGFVSAYADNLGWGTTNIEEQPGILDVTVNFTSYMGMQIDWAKTWCWGTSTVLAQQVQQLVQQTIPGAFVDAKSSAMDLGAQMTYRGPPILGRFRSRLDRARLRLAKLKSMKLPLPVKSLLLKGGIYPLAFYGLAVLPLGATHFDHLRPLCADSLFGKSASRNSAISLIAAPAALDPFEYAVVSVLRTVKRFLFQLEDHQADLFYFLASRHDAIAAHCHGPAGVLAYWLSKLGWQIDKWGHIHVHAFHKVSLKLTSMPSLARWVRNEWQKEVFQFHCSRASIRHLQFDMFATRKLIGELQPSHQPSIVLEIAGAFQTEQQKRKWASDTTGSCVHCGQPDTRFHRLYTCPATADLRAPYAPVLKALQEEGSLIHELPACVADPGAELITLVHARHPEAAILPSARQQLLQLQEEGVRLTFYTDGSLQYPTDTAARFAAYAIVFDLCRDDEHRVQVVDQWRQSGIQPITFTTLAVANTTGDQRIYRSELYALVVICEHFDAATIWTDCQSALQTALKCQEAMTLLPFLGQEDFDLVARLWVQVRKGDFLFFKVAAHVDVTPSMSHAEVYHTWGNRCANAAAIHASWHSMPDLVQECVHLHASREREFGMIRQIYALHLELHKARAQLEANNEQLQQHQQMFRATGLTPFEVLRNWELPTQWSSPGGRVHMLGECAWGLDLSRSLFNWMQLVRWPLGPADDDPGITFYELALSYILHSGYVPPIKRADAHGCEFLQPVETFESFEALGISFSELSMTFSIWMTQVRKLHAFTVWPDFEHGTTRSLYRLGATFQSRGIKVRPVIPCQEQVVSLLAIYIRKHPDCTDVPEIPVLPLTASMKRQIMLPWNKLQRKATLAVKRVRELQRTTSTLAFAAWWTIDVGGLTHLFAFHFTVWPLDSNSRVKVL